MQTTDKKVNEVSPALFDRAPDPETLAGCAQPEIQGIIKTVGLAPTKSRNIINTAKFLVVLASAHLCNTPRGCAH